MVSRSSSAKRASSTAPSAPNAEEGTTVRSEDDGQVAESFRALCLELNMDPATSEAAWRSYEAIRQRYTLEGNQLHWLSCALYVACHNSAVPTVNRQGVVEGNGVSLTRLLRSCKLALIQFFNKAKKWADMSNLKIEFRHKIDSLEQNFAVSNVIFKKYQPIFVSLFKDPAKDPPRQKTSRKQKKPPCAPGDVFDFCWVLFVRVKTDFPAISDDLVNSYHLLLSCVDYIYGNACIAKRTDLLNDSFKEGPEDLDKLTEPPCILDTLCREHDGIIAEVKSIREHWWKPHIKKFFEGNLLRGDSDNLTGILDPGNFETNAKNVRKDYEAHVLGIGEYDERVFLGEDANEEIGTPTKLMGGSNNELHHDLGEKVHARRNLSTQFDGSSSLVPTTPLSGKHYLKAKEQLKITPVSTATYLVSRLNTLLRNREPEPGPRLLELFSSCGGEQDPTKTVEGRVKEMGDKFCSHYTAASDKHPGSHDSFARMRLKMGVALYYKLLEAILVRERAQHKPLGNLLGQDIFHRALFTCCLEVVIFSYNSQRTFPWILDIFKLEPFHFYKVIEVIIRTEDSLPRDVVKHLQRIEEQILESRAWTSKSPLWEAIARDPLGVPSCEEASLPGQSAAAAEIRPHGHEQSPISHYKRAFSITRSPMAGDRFIKSPVVDSVARKQLSFGDASGVSHIVPTSPVKSRQSILSPQKTFVVQGGPSIQMAHVQLGNGNILRPGSEPVALSSIASGSQISGGNNRPKRTGSLALFFRKVYHLAHLRLDALCQGLQIVEEDVKRKIWTTLEHTLTAKTDLLKDRHLDQLLMCSLYIVCKVVGQCKNFTDIMKQYRNQPQAASHVYRSVLLRPKTSESGDSESSEKSEDYISSKMPVNPPPTPTRLAATSTIVDGEERGDLIKFYNMVFMERLQEFSLKFKRSQEPTEVPPLSPLPQLRAHPHSPCRKVNRSVYVRPLNSAAGDVVTFNPVSPHKPLSYVFSRSPVKNLNAINDWMRTEGEKMTGKRLLEDDPPTQQVLIVPAENASAGTGEGPPPTKVQIVGGATGGQGAAVNSRLELVLGDRSLSE